MYNNLLGNTSQPVLGFRISKLLGGGGKKMTYNMKKWLGWHHRKLGYNTQGAVCLKASPPSISCSIVRRVIARFQETEFHAKFHKPGMTSSIVWFSLTFLSDFGTLGWVTVLIRNNLNEELPSLPEIHVPTAYWFIRISLVSCWNYRPEPQGLSAALHWLCSWRAAHQL